MRIDAAIAEAVRRLSPVSESPRIDAEILLCRSIDVPRAYLFAHPDDELDEAALGRFRDVLERRVAGEPMAYIMGTREFWSKELLVSRATLVPRPETELLVELALGEIPRRATMRVLDLGTGSGAVAIAIASERPLCDVTATDRSPDALAVARENARQLSLPNIRFVEGDWVEPLEGETFDLVVSNPPYVRSDDPALAALAFEPRSALAAGPDGLDAIRRLAADCGAVLVPGGSIFVEHGAGQADEVAGLFAAAGWQEITLHRDLAGLPRVTAARRGGK